MDLNKAKELVNLVHQLEGLEQLADVLATIFIELESEFTLPRHIKEDLMACITDKWDEIVAEIEGF